jgi:WD40 repeat protein
VTLPCLSRAALHFGLLLLSLLLAAAQTRAEDGGADFRLDLDAGGHTARITDLAFTPDGETIVSASDDKTIRVWDWQSGVTLRTLRG